MDFSCICGYSIFAFVWTRLKDTNRIDSATSCAPAELIYLYFVTFSQTFCGKLDFVTRLNGFLI